MGLKFGTGILALSVLLSGCIGKEDSDEIKSGEQGDGSTALEVNPGGTVSNPARIDYKNLNAISADEFDNHYVVNARAGDTLIIEAEMEFALDSTGFRRCYETDTSWTGIRFIGSEDRSDRGCSRFFYYEFTEDTQEILKLGFQEGNQGFFVATLLKPDDPYFMHEGVGEGGNANLLGQVDFDGENELFGESFMNHYVIQGREGETVYLQAYVDPAEYSETFNRCQRGQGFSRHYAYGWSAMSEVRRADGNYRDEPIYNCSDYLEYTFPQDGTYHFNFRSTRNGSGHFRATRTDSPL